MTRLNLGVDLTRDFLKLSANLLWKENPPLFLNFFDVEKKSDQKTFLCSSKILLKSFSLILSLVFSLETTLTAAPAPSFTQNPAFFDTTVWSRELSSLGSYADLDTLFRVSPTPREPQIILIKDLHANPEAQRSIRGILDTLAAKKWMKTLALEGAFGPMDFHSIQKSELRPWLEQAAGKWVDRGQVTAGEWFGFGSAAFKTDIMGVDDLKLYKESLILFRKLKQDSKLQQIQNENVKALDRQAAKVLSPELLRFHHLYRGFLSAHSLDPAFLGQLSELAKTHLNLDLASSRLQWNFPSLSRLMRIREQEKSMDLENIRRDLAELRKQIDQLQSQIPDRDFFLNALDRLASDQPETNWISWLKQNEMSARKFSEKLFSFSTKNKISLFSFPSLLDYLGVKTIEEEIRGPKLISELEKLGFDLEEKMVSNQASRDWLALDQRNAILSGLTSLELSPDQWRKYQKEKSQDLHSQFQIAEAQLIPSSNIQDAERFYELCELRDQALLKNTLKISRAHGPTVLIAGGFHANGLEEAMKAQKISFVSVLPRVRALDTHGLYESIMLGKKSDMTSNQSEAMLAQDLPRALIFDPEFPAALPDLKEAIATRKEISRNFVQEAIQAWIREQGLKSGSYPDAAIVRKMVEYLSTNSIFQPAIAGVSFIYRSDTGAFVFQDFETAFELPRFHRNELRKEIDTTGQEDFDLTKEIVERAAKSAIEEANRRSGSGFVNHDGWMARKDIYYFVIIYLNHLVQTFSYPRASPTQKALTALQNSFQKRVAGDIRPHPEIDPQEVFNRAIQFLRHASSPRAELRKDIQEDLRQIEFSLNLVQQSLSEANQKWRPQTPGYDAIRTWTRKSGKKFEGLKYQGSIVRARALLKKIQNNPDLSEPWGELWTELKLLEKEMLKGAFPAHLFIVATSANKKTFAAEWQAAQGLKSAGANIQKAIRALTESYRIIPAELRKKVDFATTEEFTDMSPVEGHTLYPKLVPKPGRRKISLAQATELMRDPRGGARGFIMRGSKDGSVKPKERMAGLAVYLLTQQMSAAERPYSLGLATGGTQEIFRMAMGMMELVRDTFGVDPNLDMIRQITTLDDYYWPKFVERLTFALSSYREEQLYYMIRNLFPNKTEKEIQAMFISPTVFQESVKEAAQKWRDALVIFENPIYRQIAQMHGIGTDSHDAFGETVPTREKIEKLLQRKTRRNLWKDAGLRIPQRVIDHNPVQPDHLVVEDRDTQITDTTGVQNISHLITHDFHAFFLKFLGDQKIVRIKDLLDVLSRFSFEEINQYYVKRYGAGNKFQFKNDKHFLRELQYLLDHYDITPQQALTQGVKGMIARSDNPDTVNFFLVSSPHKEQALLQAWSKRPGVESTAGDMHLFRNSVVVVASDAIHPDLNQEEFFEIELTPEEEAAFAVFKEENIEGRWLATPEGRRVRSLKSLLTVVGHLKEARMIWQREKPKDEDLRELNEVIDRLMRVGNPGELQEAMNLLYHDAPYLLDVSRIRNKNARQAVYDEIKAALESPVIIGSYDQEGWAKNRLGLWYEKKIHSSARIDEIESETRNASGFKPFYEVRTQFHLTDDDFARSGNSQASIWKIESHSSLGARSELRMQMEEVRAAKQKQSGHISTLLELSAAYLIIMVLLTTLAPHFAWAKKLWFVAAAVPVLLLGVLGVAAVYQWWTFRWGPSRKIIEDFKKERDPSNTGLKKTRTMRVMQSWNLNAPARTTTEWMPQFLPLESIRARNEQQSWSWNFLRQHWTEERLKKLSETLPGFLTNLRRDGKLPEDIHSLYLMGSYLWRESPDDINLFFARDGDAQLQKISIPADQNPFRLPIAIEIVGKDTLAAYAADTLKQPMPIYYQRRVVLLYGMTLLAGPGIHPEGIKPPLENFRILAADLQSDRETTFWPDLDGQPEKIRAKQAWRDQEKTALLQMLTKWSGAGVRAEVRQRSEIHVFQWIADFFNFLFGHLNHSILNFLSPWVGEGFATLLLLPVFLLELAIFVGGGFWTFYFSIYYATHFVWYLFFPVNYLSRIVILEKRPLKLPDVGAFPVIPGIRAYIRFDQPHQTPALIKALDHADDRVRKEIVMLIRQTNAKSSTFKLMEILKLEKNSEIMLEIVQTLRHFDAREALPALIEALKNQTNVTVFDAIVDLAKNWDAVATLQPLTEILATSSSVAMRLAALAQIETFPYSDSKPVIVAALQHNSEAQVRNRAAKILGQRGEPADSSVLIGAVQADPDSGVRSMLLTNLGKRRTPQSLAAVTHVLAQDSDSNLRVRAANLLNAWDEPGCVAQLEGRLRSDSAKEVKRNVIAHFSVRKDRESLAALHRTLREEAEPSLRIQAARALFSRNDPESLEVFASALAEDEDSDVRLELISILNQRRGDQGFQALSKALKLDGKAELRRAVADIFHAWTGSERLAKLANQLGQDPDPGMRRHLMELLSGNNDPESLQALRLVLSKDSFSVLRQEAALILAEKQDTESLPVLAEALRNDSNTKTRLVIASIFEKWHPDGYQDLLKEISEKDSSVEVRLQSLFALRAYDPDAPAMNPPVGLAQKWEDLFSQSNFLLTMLAARAIYDAGDRDVFHRVQYRPGKDEAEAATLMLMGYERYLDKLRSALLAPLAHLEELYEREPPTISERQVTYEYNMIRTKYGDEPVGEPIESKVDWVDAVNPARGNLEIQMAPYERLRSSLNAAMSPERRQKDLPTAPKQIRLLAMEQTPLQPQSRTELRVKRDGAGHRVLSDRLDRDIKLSFLDDSALPIATAAGTTYLSQLKHLFYQDGTTEATGLWKPYVALLKNLDIDADPSFEKSQHDYAAAYLGIEAGELVPQGLVIVHDGKLYIVSMHHPQKTQTIPATAIKAALENASSTRMTLDYQQEKHYLEWPVQIVLFNRDPQGIHIKSFGSGSDDSRFIHRVGGGNEGEVEGEDAWRNPWHKRGTVALDTSYVHGTTARKGRVAYRAETRKEPGTLLRAELRAQENTELRNNILFSLISYLQFSEIDDKLLGINLVEDIQGKLMHQFPKRRLDALYERFQGKPVFTVRGAQSVARSFDVYLKRKPDVRLYQSRVFEIPNSDYAIEVKTHPRKPVKADIFGTDQDAIREQIKFINVINHLTQNGKQNLFNKFLGLAGVDYYDVIRKVRELYKGTGKNDQITMGNRPTPATFDQFREKLRQAIQEVSKDRPSIPQDDRAFINRLKEEIDGFIDLNDLMVELLHEAMDRNSLSREEANVLLFLQQVGVGVVSEEVARDIKEQTFTVNLGGYDYFFQYNPGRAKRSGLFAGNMIGRQPETIVSESYVADFLPLQRHLRFGNAAAGIRGRELANPYPHKLASRNTVFDPIQPQVVNVEDLETLLKTLRDSTPAGEGTRYRSFFNGPFAGFTIPHLHYQGFLEKTNLEKALEQNGALESIGANEQGVEYFRVSRKQFETKAQFPLRSTVVIKGREPEALAQAVIEVIKQANEDHSLPINAKSKFTYNLLFSDDGEVFRAYIMIKPIVTDPFDPKGLTLVEPNMLVFTPEEHHASAVADLQAGMKAELDKLPNLWAQVETAQAQITTTEQAIKALGEAKDKDDDRKTLQARLATEKASLKAITDQIDAVKKSYGAKVKEGIKKEIILFEGRPATVEMTDLLIFGSPDHADIFRKIKANPVLQRHVIDSVFRNSEYGKFDEVVTAVQTNLNPVARAELRLSTQEQYKTHTSDFVFRQLKRHPRYQDFHQEIQQQNETTVRSLVQAAIQKSLEIGQIEDSETESVIQAVIQKIRVDRDLGPIHLDATDAYKPRDPEISQAQRAVQHEMEEGLVAKDPAVRELVAAGEINLPGSEPDAEIQRLILFVESLRRLHDEDIVLFGDGLDASVKLFLTMLSRRENWNAGGDPAYSAPRIHIVSSRDPEGVRRLQQFLKKNNSTGVSVLSFESRQDLEADAHNAFRASMGEELGKSLTFYTHRTSQGLLSPAHAGLITAGLIQSEGWIRDYFKAAREAIKEFKDAEGNPEKIKALPAYQLAAHQARFAKTGLLMSVLVMFSSLLQHLGVFLADLMNQSVGSSPVEFWVSAEHGTTFFHSTQQGWVESDVFPSNSEYETIQRRGFYGFTFMNPIRSMDLSVSDQASRHYRGFGNQLLMRITRAALRLPLSGRALRPILDFTFQSENPGDLGRLMVTCQLAAAMTAELLRGDQPTTDYGANLDQAYERELAKPQPEAEIPTGTVERKQNILTLTRNSEGKIEFGGVTGSKMNEAAQKVQAEGFSGELDTQNKESSDSLLSRFLKIIGTFVTSKGLNKVVDQIDSGDKLEHLNAEEVVREVNKTEPMARRFAKHKRIYAFTIGGSTTGEPLVDGLNLAEGPEIIWVSSYDADLLDQAIRDIGDHPEEVGAVVISKSGNTPEVDVNSMTWMDSLMERLKRTHENIQEHVLFITDPKLGTLVEKVKREGWIYLDHPVFIGGRFSMFSSVGLIFYFLKGGLRAPLLEGVERWRKYYQGLKKLRNLVSEKYKDLFEDSSKKKKAADKPARVVTLAQKVQAAYEIYEAIQDIPGLCEGLLDNLENTLSPKQSKVREIGIAITSGFKRFLSGPLFAQIRVESKSKPGVMFHAVALWGWGVVRRTWNRLCADGRNYVTLYGETRAAGTTATAMDRAEAASWNAMTSELTVNQVPFMSFRTGGPLSVPALMDLQWIQYLRLAVDTALYTDINVESVNQAGVEATKRMFSGYLRVMNDMIRWMTGSLPASVRSAADQAIRYGHDLIIPYVPPDRTDVMSNVPMNLDDMHFSPEVGRLVNRLVAGDATQDVRGLVSAEDRKALKFSAAQNIPTYLQNRLQELLSTPDVQELFINGKSKGQRTGSKLVVRATAIEVPQAQNSGSPNGTLVGIYEQGERGELELRATVQIFWGSSVRLIISNTVIVQDYRLQPDDNKIFEVVRPGETNQIVAADSGGYFSNEGSSNWTPSAHQSFIREVISPYIAVKSRTVQVPLADIYQILNKQGLYAGFVRRSSLSEYGAVVKAAHGLMMVFTENGLRPVEEFSKVNRDTLTHGEDDWVFVYLGAEKPVLQAQAFVDLVHNAKLTLGDGSQVQMIPAILEELRKLQAETDPKIKAKALMWTLRVRELLRLLPRDGRGRLGEKVDPWLEQVEATLKANHLGEVFAALKTEYTALDLTARAAQAEEFLLLGHPEAQMRADLDEKGTPLIPAGDAMKLIYALEERFRTVTPDEILSGLRSELRRLDQIVSALEKARRISHRPGDRPKAYQKINPVTFGASLKDYLRQIEASSVSLPGLPKAISDELLKARHEVINRFFELFLHEQEILDEDQEVFREGYVPPSEGNGGSATEVETDALQKKILYDLFEKERHNVFVERGGKFYIRSLEDLYENLRPSKDAGMNPSGDITDRLDYIYNSIMLYYFRKMPGVNVLISEEPLFNNNDPIKGMKPRRHTQVKINIEGYSLVILLDPLDGTSQLAEAGAFGPIFGSFYLKPGQNYYDADLRAQGLGGFKLILGQQTIMHLANPIGPDGKREVVRFQETLGEDGKPAFRFTRKFPSLRKMQGALQWGREGYSLLPVADPKKIALIAIGGADSEFKDDDGHRALINFVRRRFGYVDLYAGGLVADVAEIIERIFDKPETYMLMLHSYGPTKEHPKGRYRFSFENIFYGWYTDYMDGETTTGFDPMLDLKLAQKLPNQVKTPMYIADAMTSKFAMAWMNHVKENPVIGKPSSAEIKEKMDAEIEAFAETYERESAFFMQALRDYVSWGLLRNDLSLETLRDAVFSLPGNIVPLFSQRSAEDMAKHWAAILAQNPELAHRSELRMKALDVATQNQSGYIRGIFMGVVAAALSAFYLVPAVLRFWPSAEAWFNLHPFLSFCFTGMVSVGAFLGFFVWTLIPRYPTALEIEFGSADPLLKPAAIYAAKMMIRFRIRYELSIEESTEKAVVKFILPVYRHTLILTHEKPKLGSPSKMTVAVMSAESKAPDIQRSHLNSSQNQKLATKMVKDVIRDWSIFSPRSEMRFINEKAVLARGVIPEITPTLVSGGVHLKIKNTPVSAKTGEELAAKLQDLVQSSGQPLTDAKPLPAHFHFIWQNRMLRISAEIEGVQKIEIILSATNVSGIAGFLRGNWLPHFTAEKLGQLIHRAELIKQTATHHVTHWKDGESTYEIHLYYMNAEPTSIMVTDLGQQWTWVFPSRLFSGGLGELISVIKSKAEKMETGRAELRNEMPDWASNLPSRVIRFQTPQQNWSLYQAIRSRAERASFSIVDVIGASIRAQDESSATARFVKLADHPSWETEAAEISLSFSTEYELTFYFQRAEARVSNSKTFVRSENRDYAKRRAVLETMADQRAFVPVIGYGALPIIRMERNLEGYSVREVAFDALRQATFMKEVIDRYKIDAVLNPMDLSKEHEAVLLANGAQPQVNFDHVLPDLKMNLNQAGLDADHLTPVDQIDFSKIGRLHIMAEYFRKMRSVYHDPKPQIATVIAPFTLAAKLLGESEVAVMIADNEVEELDRVYAYAEAFVARYVDYLIQKGGIDGVMFLDPSTGIAFPRRGFEEAFKKYSIESINRLSAKIRAQGILVGYHPCKPLLQKPENLRMIAEIYAAADVDIMSVDAAFNLAEVFDILEKNTPEGRKPAIVMGNEKTDQDYVLGHGTEGQVHESIRHGFETMRHRRRLVCTSCDLHPRDAGSKDYLQGFHDRILQFSRTAHDLARSFQTPRSELREDTPEWAKNTDSREYPFQTYQHPWMLYNAIYHSANRNQIILDSVVGVSIKKHNEPEASAQFLLIRDNPDWENASNTIGLEPRTEYEITFYLQRSEQRAPENLGVLRAAPEKMNIRLAVLDWDGTISLIRQGWEGLMAPYAAAIALGIELTEVEWSELQDEMKRDVKPDSDSLMTPVMKKLVETGRIPEDTMKWAIDMVENSKGDPTPLQFKQAYDKAVALGNKAKADAFVQKLGGDVSDPKNALTKVYLDKLYEVRNFRLAQVKSGAVIADHYLVRGGAQLIQDLQARGARVVVITGSEERSVQDEVDILQLKDVSVRGYRLGEPVITKKEMMKEIQAQSGIKDGAEILAAGDGKREIQFGVELGWITLAIPSHDNERHFDKILELKPNFRLVAPDYSPTEELAEFLIPRPRRFLSITSGGNPATITAQETTPAELEQTYYDFEFSSGRPRQKLPYLGLVLYQSDPIFAELQSRFPEGTAKVRFYVRQDGVVEVLTENSQSQLLKVLRWSGAEIPEAIQTFVRAYQDRNQKWLLIKLWSSGQIVILPNGEAYWLDFVGAEIGSVHLKKLVNHDILTQPSVQEVIRAFVESGHLVLKTRNELRQLARGAVRGESIDSKVNISAKLEGSDLVLKIGSYTVRASSPGDLNQQLIALTARTNELPSLTHPIPSHFFFENRGNAIKIGARIPLTQGLEITISWNKIREIGGIVQQYWVPYLSPKAWFNQVRAVRVSYDAKRQVYTYQDENQNYEVQLDPVDAENADSVNAAIVTNTSAGIRWTFSLTEARKDGIKDYQNLSSAVRELLHQRSELRAKSGKRKAAEVTDVTDDNYADFIKKGLVVVAVGAERCPHCEEYKPTLLQAAQGYQGRVKIGRFELPDTASVFRRTFLKGVNAIPYTIIFKDGQVIDQYLGKLSLGGLTEWIDSKLENRKESRSEVRRNPSTSISPSSPILNLGASKSEFAATAIAFGFETLEGAKVRYQNAASVPSSLVTGTSISLVDSLPEFYEGDGTFYAGIAQALRDNPNLRLELWVTGQEIRTPGNAPALEYFKRFYADVASRLNIQFVNEQNLSARLQRLASKNQNRSGKVSVTISSSNLSLLESLPGLSGLTRIHADLADSQFLGFDPVRLAAEGAIATRSRFETLGLTAEKIKQLGEARGVLSARRNLGFDQHASEASGWLKALQASQFVAQFA